MFKGGHTTQRQWKAFEACAIEKLTHAQAAVMFGISRSAVSKRIARYLERSGEQIHRGRRRIVNTVSLSLLGDAA